MLKALTQFLVRPIFILLLAVFGTDLAFSAQGDWTRISYALEVQEPSLQPVNLTHTARAPPTASANVMATGTAFAQTGNLRALDGVESTGVVYAVLLSPLAPNRTLPDGYRVVDDSIGAQRVSPPDGYRWVADADGNVQLQSTSNGRVYQKNIDDLPESSRPSNLTPDGAGRSGAFNQAKRDAGIPTSQQPVEVLPNVDRQGNLQPGYQYVYEVPSSGGGTQRVIIRDDAGGHIYIDDPTQNRGPHFNTPDGGHYDY